MPAAAHDRYLFKPHSGSSHVWALAQCEQLPQQTRVLDVGAGSGAIGRKLKERGFAHLAAVEPDPAAREHIAGYYTETAPDLDRLAGRQFDLVLLLDVLEHTVDPQAFLGQVLKLLRPGGLLLLSVPNVAHWSVRFQLLFGFFNYTERGILDRGHFVFFTRRSLLNMIKASRLLRVEQMDSSIAPLEFVLPAGLCGNAAFRAFSRFRLFCSRAWPGMLAYQHLARLRKQEMEA